MEDAKKMLEKFDELKPAAGPLRDALNLIERRYAEARKPLTDRLEALDSEEENLGRTFADEVLLGNVPSYRHLDEIPAEKTQIEANLAYLKAQVGPVVDDFRQEVNHFDSLTRRVAAGIPALKPIADRISSLEKATTTIIQRTGPGSGTDPLFGRLQHERESYAAQVMQINQAIGSMVLIINQAKRLDFVDIP